MKKLLTVAGLAGLLAMVAVAAVLMTGSGGSLAVPAEVPGGVGPIHVITRDGRMFTFPEVAVTCTLAGFKEDSDEPVYACPVPYDINALVSDENTGRTDASAADTIVTGYGYASGLPSGQWRTMQGLLRVHLRYATQCGSGAHAGLWGDGAHREYHLLPDNQGSVQELFLLQSEG